MGRRSQRNPLAIKVINHFGVKPKEGVQETIYYEMLSRILADERIHGIWRRCYENIKDDIQIGYHAMLYHVRAMGITWGRKKNSPHQKKRNEPSDGSESPPSQERG